MKRLSKIFNALWYDGRYKGLFYALLPLSWVYGGLMQLRRFFYAVKKPSLGISQPVIVVGNLTVGGTGKTPLILILIALLRERGLKVGVVARGYGSEAERSRVPVLLAPHHTATQVGDEPFLIFAKTQVPFVVCPKRREAVRCLVAAHPDLDVVLSDDGLQHLALPRQMEIVVVEAKRRFGNEQLLPAGPLREPLSRLNTVECIAVNGEDFTIQPQGLRPLQGGAVLPLHYLQGRRVYAVAGIGHPERFFVLLQSLGAEVEPKAFLDHHAFEAADFSGFENEFIVMTEKDAVKCQHLKLPQAVFLEITANMTPVFARAILEKIQYTLPHEYRTKNEPFS